MFSFETHVCLLNKTNGPFVPKLLAAERSRVAFQLGLAQSALAGGFFSLGESLKSHQKVDFVGSKSVSVL